MNTYLYALANPTNFTDPTGLITDKAAIGGGILLLCRLKPKICTRALGSAISAILGAFGGLLPDDPDGDEDCKENCPLKDARLKLIPTREPTDEKVFLPGRLECIYQCPTKGQQIEPLAVTEFEVRELGISGLIDKERLMLNCRLQFGDPRQY